MGVRKKMICEHCEKELDEEEQEAPREDKAGNIICDKCFDEKYMFTCAICEELFEEDFSKRISPQYLFISEYAGEDLNISPGIYEIIAYPFFADGVIEIHIFTSALRRVANVPPSVNESEQYGDIFYVCKECVGKQKKQNNVK